MITISVDTSGLSDKIAKKSLAMKKSLGVALKEEAGLLCVSLTKYTQPFGLNNKARDMGKSAIVRDLTEAFYIFPDLLLARATVRKDGDMQFFIGKDKVVWITSQENFKITADTQALVERHNAVRNRNGRIPRNKNKVDNNGQVARINIWVIGQGQFNDLLKAVQSKVGFAKAGWVTCAGQLGRSNSDIPTWIRNQQAPGNVIDQSNSEKPSITMINEVNYTGRVLSESAKRLAITEREVKLQGAIDRAIKYGVKDK